MYKHPDTFMRAEELGSRIPPYEPTHAFAGQWVDGDQERLAQCELRDGVLVQLRSGGWAGEVIPGWLRMADALKLYELAYFAQGDILELGSYHGLSASIMARAVINSGRSRRIVTVDLDPACTAATRATLDSFPFGAVVETVTAEAAAAVRDLAAQGRKFDFAFIDHSHAFGPVKEACGELHKVLQPGSLCLFHDFNDSRNNDPNEPDYGVYQAVIAGLDPARFEFFGIYGCTGLYRFIG